MGIQFAVVKHVSEKALHTLKTWLYKLSRPVPREDMVVLTTQSYQVVLKNAIPTLVELCDPQKDPSTIIRRFVIRREMGGSIFNMLKAKTDPNYVYNPNVGGTFPTQWLDQQKDYIFGLPWKDKVRVLTYSYAGDKIVNSFLLGTLSFKSMVDDEFRTTFYRHIFPLALDMYLHTRRFATYDDWVAFCGHEGNLTIETSWRPLFERIHELSFESAYSFILGFIEREKNTITDRMWYTWAGEYILHLNAIIHEAPRVPSPGFYTFRGVHDASYVTANHNNVFINETFMSTSIDMGTGLKFVDSSTNCCLFTLQVLPGSRCLFLGSLSYFPLEAEVLFAPGRKLFITKKQFSASNPNANLLVTRFSLMNS